METAPLKSFASWSRTALIREVAARIAVVLAPASPQRVEQPKAIAALEAAITAAGGGDKGRGVVADRVAYTWFNRIIALRFMDANGYTGIGVVSPQAGVEVGQPEILAEAKRANVDPDVVSLRIRESVSALLNGTRRSDDPQGEAYALLLIEYCRYWNRAMPFMFEREGDFTELLMPGNLLADDSVLNRAVKVLTETVCQDVEVIGWLYQFYISERKDEVFAGFKKNLKAGAEEIPAATQLFTPHWIVRYLVENSLGRLWMLNHPTSRLVDQMDYYIAPAASECDFIKIAKPEDLRVVDPACGSGHMLTYAFDLLYAIYEEVGYAPAEIPGLILLHNLYGVEIDPRAGGLAAFALTMKARARQRTFLNKRQAPNICVLEPIQFSTQELEILLTATGDAPAEKAFWNQFEHADEFGSLIRPNPDLIAPLTQHVSRLKSASDLLSSGVVESAARVLKQSEYLGSRYAVVVANPPYMGGANMSPRLATFAKSAFPSSKSDLFAMFIERSFELLMPAGYSAMVTMESWMFLKSLSKLRRNIVLEKTIENVLHMPYLGKGSTSMGINFGTVAAVVRNAVVTGAEAAFQCVRYFETDSNGVPVEFPIRNERFARLSARRFAAIPGIPIAYWFPDRLLQLFEEAPTVSNTARAAIGLVTGDNSAFVRQWWEVSKNRISFGNPDRISAQASGCRWFPYAKGGEFRRWAGNLDAVVNWENDGHALQTTTTDDGSRIRGHNFNLDRIFKPGIAWTAVTSGALSFREVGPGCLFDAAAGLCQSSDDKYLLALLNSDAAAQVLQGLNPTLNLHPGYLESVPMPRDDDKEKIREIASRAVDISSTDWNSRERSWSFDRQPLLDRSHNMAHAVEDLLNECRIYTEQLRGLESKNDEHFARLFGLSLGERTADTVSLSFNPDFSFGGIPPEGRKAAMTRDVVTDFVSYAVGCIFGRYSLDEPGLILADQGATLSDYLVKVPHPLFMPDADNVIPIVDGDWFEDDVVTRFRQFLRAAFGEKHFEENLRFVTEALGVKDLRDYFVKSFYKDHVQRYKKRPIYWLFSSPKGSFNALIYMHRYTPSTVSTVLNEYLREFKAKLEATLGQQERLAAGGGTPRQQAAAQKEADRIRKMLLELNEYEHDVLYPLASQQIEIDLDDGVKVNYPKFGAALRKIPGLEAGE